MRRVVIGFVAVLVTSSMMAGVPPASADCSGPHITVSPSRALPGATVNIQGQAFGDSCYDTGPPPAGQGALGTPLTDVEIGFVQDGVTTVVATVDADNEYQFSVDVTVPADAEPGQAAFTAIPPEWVTITGFTVAGSVTPAAPIGAAPDFTG